LKTRILSFGSLASPLAKAQTQAVVSRLQILFPRLTCQMTMIPSPLAEQEKEGEPFMAASAAEVEYLEEQLLAEEFRLMVVRATDLVLPLREGVTYCAVPERDTPFDAFLNRQGKIADEMEDASRIGVLNLRSKIQMKALWPDLGISILPGGLDAAMETLLRKCEVDGLVIPAAATEHLGIQGIVSEIFYPEMILPSSGQGILVLLCRSEDKEVRDLLKDLHSEATFLEMEAEHAFMQHFASDQDLPVAVLARVERGRIEITGAVGSIQGENANKLGTEGDAANAVALGTGLAQNLLGSLDSVIELLAADFPDGLPAEDVDEIHDDNPEFDPDIEAELAQLELPPEDDD